MTGDNYDRPDMLLWCGSLSAWASTEALGLQWLMQLIPWVCESNVSSGLGYRKSYGLHTSLLAHRFTPRTNFAYALLFHFPVFCGFRIRLYHE